MMDDSAPTHDETYKNVLPQKRTVVAEVCGEIHSKNDNIFSSSCDIFTGGFFGFFMAFAGFFWVTNSHACKKLE